MEISEFVNVDCKISPDNLSRSISKPWALKHHQNIKLVLLITFLHATNMTSILS
jgi:predicted glycosyltransferase involved in capsule biosynthesis